MYDYEFPLNAPDLTPSIARSPLYARLFDRFAHQGAENIGDDDKRRLFKQGLLQFAANVSKPNGGNFTNAVATGLLAGSQGMNQGVDDLGTRRYKNALLDARTGDPSEFRAADAMARAAGFQPGTKEYEHFMRVKGGIDARQSSAAIQYKQQMGEDGVMRYVAFDPNQVGAEAVGAGQTYGAPVGRPQMPYPQQPPQQAPAPQQAPPQAPNVDAVLAQANEMAQQGAPSEQIDAWVQTQLNPQTQAPQPAPPQAAPLPPQAGGLPPMRSIPLGPSPFASRPQEQQKALEAGAEAQAKLSVEQSGYPMAAQQAGNLERAKVLANAGANAQTAGAQANTAGTIEAGKVQAQDAAKMYSQIQEAAKMARTENNNLRMLSSDLAGTYTGPGANAVLGAKRAASALGLKVDGMGEAEAARALSNRMALALRNPAGGEGMPGAMSDADRNFLLQSVPNLQSTPAGWKAMVKMRLALNQNAIDQAQYANRLRMSGVPVQNIPAMLQQWAEEHPIFHPQQPAPASGGWGIQKVGG